MCAASGRALAVLDVRQPCERTPGDFVLGRISFNLANARIQPCVLRCILSGLAKMKVCHIAYNDTLQRYSVSFCIQVHLSNSRRKNTW